MSLLEPPRGFPTESLDGNLGEFVNNPHLADVVFTVESQRFHAHRFILARRCDYFKVAFLGIGGLQNLDLEMEIRDTSAEVFLALLTCIYTGVMPDVASLPVWDLFLCSRTYKVPRLQQHVEDYLSDNLSVESLCGIWVQAQMYGATSLLQRCTEFFRLKMEDVVQTRSFAALGTRDLVMQGDLLRALGKPDKADCQDFPGDSLNCNADPVPEHDDKSTPGHVTPQRLMSSMHSPTSTYSSNKDIGVPASSQPSPQPSLPTPLPMTFPPPPPIQRDRAPGMLGGYGLKNANGSDCTQGRRGASSWNQTPRGMLPPHQQMQQHVQQHVYQHQQHHLQQQQQRQPSETPAATLFRHDVARFNHPQEQVQVLMNMVTCLCDSDRATLFLHERESDKLCSMIIVGDQAFQVRLPSHMGVAGAVFGNGQLLNVPQAYRDTRFLAQVDRMTGFRTQSLLCAPVEIMVNQHLVRVGVVEALNKRDGRQFTMQDERHIVMVAEQIATLIERGHLALWLEMCQPPQGHGEHAPPPAAADPLHPLPPPQPQPQQHPAPAPWPPDLTGSPEAVVPPPFADARFQTQRNTGPILHYRMPRQDPLQLNDHISEDGDGDGDRDDGNGGDGDDQDGGDDVCSSKAAQTKNRPRKRARLAV